MKRYTLALFALAALGLAQQTPGQNPQASPDATGGNVVVLGLRAMAMSNQFEIDASKAALAKNIRDAVKRYAQKMIDEHTKNQQALQQLARSKNVALPQDEGVQNRLVLLNASLLQGPDFERAYLKAQVDGHEMAALFLDTMLKAGGNEAMQGTPANPGQGQGQGQGNNPQTPGLTLDNDVRQYVQAILPAVRQHLAEATELYQQVTR